MVLDVVRRLVERRLPELIADSLAISSRALRQPCSSKVQQP
jgi:hypothetical protein